jgi:hypothetical protein
MSTPKQGPGFVIQDAQPIQFTTFVLGLASTAFIHLGDAPHPETGNLQADVLLARESIELLSMLREKTRGNLTAEEERIFDEILTRLRLRFVEATRR